MGNSRLFQFDDGTCMHGGECHCKCDINVCPVRTTENAWRNRNAMYGIMAKRGCQSRFPEVTVLNLIKHDISNLRVVLKHLRRTERIYMDTDSDLRKFE